MIAVEICRDSVERKHDIKMTVAQEPTMQDMLRNNAEMMWQPKRLEMPRDAQRHPDAQHRPALPSLFLPPARKTRVKGQLDLDWRLQHLATAWPGLQLRSV